MTFSLIDEGTEVICEHLAECDHWDSDVFVGYPIQAIVKGAGKLVAQYKIGVCDNLLAVDNYGRDLLPEVQRILRWVFVARTGIRYDLPFMRSSFAVLHVPYRGALEQRHAEPLGSLQTLVAHVTKVPRPGDFDDQGRRVNPEIIMRVYHTVRDSAGGLIIGGPSGMVQAKSVMMNPMLLVNDKRKSRIADTPLGQSLMVHRTGPRLNLLNSTVFNAALRQVAALRASAAYCRATQELNRLASAHGTTLSAILDDPPKGAVAMCVDRKMSRSFFVAKQLPVWQRFVLTYGVDDALTDDEMSRTVECSGATGACVVATRDDLENKALDAFLVEDLSPIVKATQRVMLDGCLVESAEQVGDNADGVPMWRIQLVMGDTYTLTQDEYVARYTLQLLPQVVSLTRGLNMKYSPLPCAEDFTASTAQGVPVMLG